MSGIPLRFIGGPLNGKRQFFAPETAREGAYYRVPMRKRHPGVFSIDQPVTEPSSYKLYEYRVKTIRSGDFDTIMYLGPSSTSVAEDLKKRFAP
jgi:hypothetical protein